MSVEIGLVFRDLTKLPTNDAALQQFLVQSVVPAIKTKLSESTGVREVQDPNLDSKSVEISVGIRF